MKTERLCAEDLRLLLYHQKRPPHSPLNLLRPFLHACFVQQPFHLSAKHPHHITLGTDVVWVGLAPSRHGTRGPQHLLECVQIHLRLTNKELLGDIPVLPEKCALVEFWDGMFQGPREGEVDVPVPSKNVTRHDIGRQMLLVAPVHGSLDCGDVGDGRVDEKLATSPHCNATTWLEYAGGTWPEARHVEPVRGVGSGDEIDAGILNRWREVLSKFFSSGDLEADGFRSGCHIAHGASDGDHAFGRIDANGVGEAWSEPVGGGTGAAADIEESVELTTTGYVVVDDGLIHARVIVAADMGVSFGLFLVVGAERLFRWEWSGSGSRLGHGEQLRCSLVRHAAG